MPRGHLQISTRGPISAMTSCKQMLINAKQVLKLVPWASFWNNRGYPYGLTGPQIVGTETSFSDI